MHSCHHKKLKKTTCTRLPVIHLRQPSWLEVFLKKRGAVFQNRNERLRLVIELSHLNVANGTGGPFGAAVFDLQTGKLLAPGVNMVAGSKCSVAHAEIMAIMTAQQLVGHYDLAHGTNKQVELVTSTEPCAMCQGAIVWSGVSSLVYAARGIDACRIGFDEGPKAANWISQFRKRGITVTGGVCRKEAVAVLRNYLKRGGLIYNGAFNAAKDALC